jgi:hypothetical protein
MVVRSSGVRTPPLLHAVIGSRVDSVEFFLSDTPHRLYNEFAKTKQAREDPRLQHIMASPGGFNRAISKWLGGDSRFCPCRRFFCSLKYEVLVQKANSHAQMKWQCIVP